MAKRANEGTSTGQQQSSRKRVRFCNGNKIQSVVNIRPVTQDEKTSLWLQPEEKRMIRQSMKQQARCVKIGDRELGSMGREKDTFGARYMTLLWFCCLHHPATGEEETALPWKQAMSHLTVATIRTISNVRGVEYLALPKLGIHRNLARKEFIQRLVRDQEDYRGDPEQLRQLSLAATRPCRQMGQLIGYIDAMSAVGLFDR